MARVSFTTGLPVLLRAGAAASALALLAACSAGTSTDGSTDPGAAAADPAADTAGENPPVTVAIGGDVIFEGVMRRRLEENPETAMGPISTPLTTADVAMVNLETPVTDRGTRAPGGGYRFRVPAPAFTALSSAGIDVASLANNHGMDYGVEGLEDTLANADDAGVRVMGAGLDAEEAYAPEIFDTPGGKVAVIGATDVLDDHLLEAWTAGEDKPGLASAKNEMRGRLVEAVSAASKQADNVITYLHWGLVGDYCPLEHAPGLAQELVDAGADAVVGGHAHEVSPSGYLGDSFVQYGLGNFGFYNYYGPTAETGLLTLTFQNGEVVGDQWQPAQLEDGVPRVYEGAAAEEEMPEWQAMNDACGLDLTQSPEGGGQGGNSADAAG